MKYPSICPDCKSSLYLSPHHCAECDWRPWYLTPITLGMTVFTVFTVLLVGQTLTRKDVPLIPIAHSLPAQEDAAPRRRIQRPAAIPIANWQDLQSIPASAVEEANPSSSPPHHCPRRK